MLLQRKQISDCYVQAEHPLQNTSRNPSTYSALLKLQLKCCGQQRAQQVRGSTNREAIVGTELEFRYTENNL